jgi:hypothetical protein
VIRLVEIYARFSSTIATSRLESTASALLAAAEKQAQTHYGRRYRGVTVEVSARLEQASTKAWATVVGAAAILLRFLSDYGSVRSGLDHLIQDGQKFSDTIVRQLPSVLGVPGEEPVSTQVRRGVPGELQRLFSQVEHGQMTAEEATRRALAILNRHADELGAEAPVLFERLERELRQAAPREQLTIQGTHELPGEGKLPPPFDRNQSRSPSPYAVGHDESEWLRFVTKRQERFCCEVTASTIEERRPS